MTFRYHLEVALGSQGEVEVQLEIAHRPGFIDDAGFRKASERAETVGRLLTRLIEGI